MAAHDSVNPGDDDDNGASRVQLRDELRPADGGAGGARAEEGGRSGPERAGEGEGRAEGKTAQPLTAHRWKRTASKTLWEDTWMENGEEVTWQCEGCGAPCTTTAMDKERGVRCESPGPPAPEDLPRAGVHPDCQVQTVVEVHRL